MQLLQLRHAHAVRGLRTTGRGLAAAAGAGLVGRTTRLRWPGLAAGGPVRDAAVLVRGCASDMLPTASPNWPRWPRSWATRPRPTGPRAGLPAGGPARPGRHGAPVLRLSPARSPPWSGRRREGRPLWRRLARSLGRRSLRRPRCGYCASKVRRLVLDNPADPLVPEAARLLGRPQARPATSPPGWAWASASCCAGATPRSATAQRRCGGCCGSGSSWPQVNAGGRLPSTGQAGPGPAGRRHRGRQSGAPDPSVPSPTRQPGPAALTARQQPAAA